MTAPPVDHQHEAEADADADAFLSTKGRWQQQQQQQQAVDQTATATATTITNTEENNASQWMVDQLSNDELEQAARSSYKYYASNIINHSPQIDGSPQSDGLSSPTSPTPTAVAIALAMARRHLVAQKGRQDLALASMKRTLEWRQHGHIDLIRTCFVARDDSDDIDKEKDSELRETLRNGLYGHLKNGKVVIRGVDTQDRPLYCVTAKLEMHTGWTHEYYVPTLCHYMLERAIAIAEANNQEQIIVAFDYRDFSLRHSAPLSVTKQFLDTFREHYPERVKHIVICHAPWIFRTFWALVKPFVDPMSKKKIIFAKDPEHVFTEVIPLDPQEAQPFMLPHGKLVDPPDMDQFLFEIPFDQGYHS